MKLKIISIVLLSLLLLLNTNVSAISNPTIDLFGDISIVLPDNSSVVAGNFTIYSIGDDNLTNITFTVYGLSGFGVVFSPINQSVLGVNMSQVVYVNVSVPFAQSPGNYIGIINISSVNGGSDTVDINVTVEPRREWDMTPKSCVRSENPDIGTVCLVTLKNTGNVPLNFTINPVDINYTWVNETNVTVAKDSIYVVEFLYDVTNVIKDFYFENYTIDATEVDAVPQYYDFNITLIPYIVPLFSVNLSDVVAQQDASIEIFANITDRSITGINWTMLNVTLPNGTVDTFNMSLISTNGTSSLWFFNYSGNMSDFINYTDGNVSLNISNYTGTTVARGTYNMIISSQDNTGVVGVYSSSFKIYTNLVIGFTLGSTKYYQGSTGMIYYTVTDTNEEGIEDANVTISLKNPNGYLTYLENFMTDSTGQVSPVPTFPISNDATVGVYNFSAEMTYYDTVLETNVTFVDNSTFTLQSGSSGGGGSLEAKVSTTVLWYPNNIMRFDMLFSYAGNMTTPDNMTLNVYDPAGNIYFNISSADANKTYAGYYTYKYAMPMSSASGAYRAELKIVKDGFIDYDTEYFRVSKGGPYDVKIIVLPPMDVPLGDYVDFEIYVENMGEVLQDVYLDYWISSSNNTYYHNSEVILTQPQKNVTIFRTADIYSNQSLGLTTLNLNAKYSSVQPSIVSNTTFQVINDSPSTCIHDEILDYSNNISHLSPKNQDQILDEYKIDLTRIQFINNSGLYDTMSYSILISDNNSNIIQNTTLYNTTDLYNLHFLWNGTSNGVYVSDGIYNISIDFYLKNSTDVFNKTIDFGQIEIDNTGPIFTISNSTPIINKTTNFTFNITFPEDTLYWEINRLPYNGSKKELKIEWDGKPFEINASSWSSCSDTRPPDEIGITQTTLCGSSSGGGGSSCSGSADWPDLSFSEGNNKITITAYDKVHNSHTETLTVYVDLVDEPDESYVYETFSKYWNYFFLPKTILETIPSLNGNYSVQNVLKSLDNNFNILYYYNKSSDTWLSYNPNRPINDFINFPDDANTPYWINMTQSDTLAIR